MIVDPPVLAAGVVVMAVAATVQGSVGFGANLLAAPTLALLDPDLVPGPTFLAAGVLTFAVAWRERGAIDRAVVGWGTLGRLPGSVAGAMVLAAVSDRALQVTVAVTILVAVVLSTGLLSIRESRATFVGAGAVSGFGATSAAIGGPPMALALQHREGPALRATMGAFFAVGTLVTLPAIAAAGRLGPDELAVAAVLAPGSVLGFVASGPLRARVDAGRVRPLVLALSSASAVALLVRATG